jgi:hypothetical protein
VGVMAVSSHPLSLVLPAVPADTAVHKPAIPGRASFSVVMAEVKAQAISRDEKMRFCASGGGTGHGEHLAAWVTGQELPSAVPFAIASSRI